MKNNDFFERLYLGYQAEHLVAGQLFGAGFEALKLPADFGFDLMITSQRHTKMGSKSKTARELDKPYLLQVKSRISKEEKQILNKNGRYENSFEFQIKASEYNLMKSDKNSFLVLVCYLPSDDALLFNPVACVWLCGVQLEALKKENFLIEKKYCDSIKYSLTLYFLSKPMVNKVDYLKNLKDDDVINERAYNKLIKDLPDFIPRAWNAKSYCSLIQKKRDGTKGENSTGKILSVDHLDLSKIKPTTRSLA